MSSDIGICVACYIGKYCVDKIIIETNGWMLVLVLVSKLFVH